MKQSNTEGSAWVTQLFSRDNLTKMNTLYKKNILNKIATDVKETFGVL
jgi:hypothetical protein